MTLQHPIARNMSEWMRVKFGPKWILARRQSKHLARYYPDSVIVTPKQYAAEAIACAAVHGAYDLPPDSLETPAYVIRPARYAKGKFVVHTSPDGTGWKTRAARLIGDGLNGRYSGRSHGYIVSKATADEFESLYAAGWDANAVTGALEAPQGDR